MQYISKVTQKGQVTIPAPLRKLLDLHTGESVQFETQDRKIVLSKQKSDIRESFGMYSVKRKVTLKDIQKAIEEGPLDDLD